MRVFRDGGVIRDVPTVRPQKTVGEKREHSIRSCLSVVFRRFSSHSQSKIDTLNLCVYRYVRGAFARLVQCDGTPGCDISVQKVEYPTGHYGVPHHRTQRISTDLVRVVSIHLLANGSPGEFEPRLLAGPILDFTPASPEA